MQKGKDRRDQHRDILPEEFDSISDAATFWETHDSADYEDMMEEVEFEVDIKRHMYLVPIAGILFSTDFGKRPDLKAYLQRPM